MRSPRQDARVLVFLLVLGLLNVAADRAPAPPGRQQIQPIPPILMRGAPVTPPPTGLARGNILKMDKSVEKQIFKLPPNQLIEVKGKPMTVADIRARILAKRRRVGAARGASGKVSAESLAALQANLEKDQKSKLDAENAKVGAELARLARRQDTPAQSSRLQAIRHEALEIQQRYPAASPAQKMKDDARAKALLEEYQKLAR